MGAQLVKAASVGMPPTEPLHPKEERHCPIPGLPSPRSCLASGSTSGFEPSRR